MVLSAKMTWVFLGFFLLFICISILQGCASGRCVRYEYQTVNVEVCDRWSNTGHCAHRHWETKTRKVCVEREKPLPKPDF